MMYNEFMKIAGYEVKYEDYKNIIEPMYMATDLNKEEFVKVIDRKRFEVKKPKMDRQLMNAMKKCMASLQETCGRFIDNAKYDELENLCTEFYKRFGFDGYFTREGYEIEELNRGCTYPKEIHFYYMSSDNDLVVSL